MNLTDPPPNQPFKASIIPSGWLQWLVVSISIGVFLVAFSVLYRELGTISFMQVIQEWQVLGLGTVLISLIFVIISYFASANYDRLALNYVNYPLKFRQSIVIGFTAAAVSHNVGFAALSGGSIRFRAYTKIGLPAIDIAKIITFCSFTFFIGNAFLLGVALLSKPLVVQQQFGLNVVLVQLIAGLFVTLSILYLLASTLSKYLNQLQQLKIPIPKVTIALQQTFFASLDLVAAAAVLYVLLPADIIVAYPELLAAFLIAIFLGVMSTVPGGIGVFEGLMLLLLPNIPRPEFLSAIIIYRVMYYILPLIVALLVLGLKEWHSYRQLR